MDDARAVRGVEGRGDLRRVGQRVGDGQRPARRACAASVWPSRYSRTRNRMVSAPSDASRQVPRRRRRARRCADGSSDEIAPRLTLEPLAQPQRRRASDSGASTLIATVRSRRCIARPVDLADPAGSPPERRRSRKGRGECQGSKCHVEATEAAASTRRPAMLRRLLVRVRELDQRRLPTPAEERHACRQRPPRV